MIAAVGQPVPNTPHAISVSLPSWKANVGYEEGEEWVLSKMMTGYPRFFIHLTIRELENEVLERHGKPGERVMLFPSPATARRCHAFLLIKIGGVSPNRIRLLNLVPSIDSSNSVREHQTTLSSLSCVFSPEEYTNVAKQIWQHSGDGISSRRGEFCLKAIRDGFLKPVEISPNHKRDDSFYSKGPRRYQRSGSQSGTGHSATNGPESAANGTSKNFAEGKEYAQFIEERFGRNLNTKLAAQAKLAIRRRIAGCLTDDVDLDQALEKPIPDTARRVKGLTEEDVYLYPTGMSAIFNSHRILMANCPEPRKSICFGFPYIDTLKILQKWGPGCLFYGHGSAEDLLDLEARLEKGERYLALFTEFPSNPLLNSPNLTELRHLADKYDFALVVDETVGNFINVNVLAHADIVNSSLTKIFTGECNVMGGASVLNPHSRLYQSLKKIVEVEYQDNYWAEDAVFMERNSRDFVSRIERININAEAVAETLQSSTLVRQVYYPKFGPTSANYKSSRNPNGGYGGLLSVTLKKPEHAVSFFDALEVQKGPSLGTNFTLSCPYTILAHYNELDWAASFGVEADLIRISVGLEDREELIGKIERALHAVQK